LQDSNFGELLSSREVAAITGFTMNQLRNFRQRVDSAPFGFVRQGGSAWYLKGEIDAWVQENGTVPWTYIPTASTTDGMSVRHASGQASPSEEDATRTEFWSLAHREIEQGVGKKLHGNAGLDYVLPKLKSNDYLPNFADLVARVRFEYQFQSMRDLDLWFEEDNQPGKTVARLSQKLVKEIATVLAHAQGLGFLIPAGIHASFVRSLSEMDINTGLANYSIPSMTELEVWVRHPDGEDKLAVEGRWQGTQIRDNIENTHAHLVGLLQRGTSVRSQQGFWH